MRPLVVAIVIATGIAACSIPDKHLLDAPSGPLDCVHQGLPTTAPDRVTISGIVKDAPSRNVLVGASVDGFQVSTNLPTLTLVKTDAQGKFSGTHGTPGRPVEEYLRIISATLPPTPATKYYDTYGYSAVPVAGDVDVGEVVVYSDEGVNEIIASLQFSPSQTPDMMTKGMLTVSVSDCTGAPLGGATVTTSIPAGVGGDVHYLGADGVPSPTATVTDNGTGTALIFNVPEDTITIDATFNGMRLRSNRVSGVKAAVVEVDIRPGPL